MFGPIEEDLEKAMCFLNQDQQDQHGELPRKIKKVKKQIPKCINALGVLSEDGVSRVAATWSV